MLNSLQAQFESLVTPAMAERLTLLFNHVLASEPAAAQRLLPHAGSHMQLVLQNWPALLPPPPALRWRITPAGLLEWAGVAGAAAAPASVGAATVAMPELDLTMRLDAANPAALLARGLFGQVPPVQVEGDAQLAGDVNWLIQNVRWDVAADVERLFGPALSQPLHQLGAAVAEGLRRAVAGAQGLGERLRAWRS